MHIITRIKEVVHVNLIPSDTLTTKTQHYDTSALFLLTYSRITKRAVGYCLNL